MDRGDAEFLWPQIEDGRIDQRMPQAVRAVAAFARGRASDDELRLLYVEAPAEQPGDAAGPLRGLEDMDIPVVALPASLLTDVDGSARREAWRRLASGLEALG